MLQLAIVRSVATELQSPSLLRVHSRQSGTRLVILGT